MEWSVYIPLSLMMFFQYAVWGAWAPVLASYLLGPLKMSGKQTGWIFATLWLAFIISPFVGGQMADRWFATEWLLAVAHLVGSVVLLIAARKRTFVGLFVLMCIYSFLYATTISLTNSLMFQQMALHKMSAGQSGLMRVWGTIGWIVAGLGLTMWRRSGKTPTHASDTLVLAAIVSLVLGVLCFLLPHTPPTTTAAWRAGSNYNKNFNAKSMVTIEGTVEGADTYVPELGSTAGTQLEVKKKDGQTVTVYAGPGAYATRQGITFGKGDDIKATGSQTRVKTASVIMASEIVKGSQTLRLYEPAGQPQWKAEDLVLPSAFLKALKMLADPVFLIFVLISFVVTTEVQFYFIPTAPFLEDIGVQHKNVSGVMTLAQFSEILGMVVLLPWLMDKVGIGYRWGLAIGVIAWPMRYIVFAIMRPKWLVVASLTMHGIGYTFFLFLGQKYVDSVAAPDVRASAQALIFAVTLGLGNFIGTQFTGVIMDYFKKEGKFRWRPIFLVPCLLTITCALAFLLFFHPAAAPAQEEGPAKPAAGAISRPATAPLHAPTTAPKAASQPADASGTPLRGDAPAKTDSPAKAQTPPAATPPAPRRNGN